MSTGLLTRLLAYLLLLLIHLHVLFTHLISLFYSLCYFTCSLSRSQVHGKEVFVHDINASVSYVQFQPVVQYGRTRYPPLRSVPFYALSATEWMTIILDKKIEPTPEAGSRDAGRNAPEIRTSTIGAILRHQCPILRQSVCSLGARGHRAELLSANRER